MPISQNGKFKNKISYTVLSNVAIRDVTLSPQARGLYAVIRSYITIENFTLYKDFLFDQFPCGVRAFNTMWNELKEKGYLKQYRHRIENGFTYEYDLLDEPDTSYPATINVRMDGTIVDNTYEDQETFDDIMSSNDPCLDIEVDDEDEIKSQINYFNFKDEPFIDEIVDTVLEINNSEEPLTTIGDEQIPTRKLKSMFKRLDSHIIKEVIERLKIYNKPIINIKSFLITVLYNAIPYEHSTGTDPP